MQWNEKYSYDIISIQDTLFRQGQLKILNDNIKRIAIQPPRMATPQQRVINNEAEEEYTRAVAQEEIRRQKKKQS